MATRTKPPHMQIDEDNQRKRPRRRWQPSRPVRDSELLEEAHRSPVIQRGLLEPGLAIKDRGHRSSSEAVIGRLKIRKPQTSRNHLCLDLVAGVRMSREHLPRDLRVAWLIGPNQAELIASK